MKLRITTALAVAGLAIVGHAAPAAAKGETEADAKADAIVRPPTDPYPSTYAAPTAPATLIRGATVLDGLGGEFVAADVLIENGKIAALGEALAAPAGARVIEAAGKFVTPGVIDVHSHLGVYPSPGITATSDGNEATDPVTAEVWAEHSVWPQDPGFSRAVAGGITALHILPGSANLMGGRGVTLRPALGAVSVQEMKFPGAPYTLKMACGENPARVYGSRGQSPATGMGNVAGYRQAFAKAQEYDRSWKAYWKEAEAAVDAPRRRRSAEAELPDPPDRDLQMETLAGVLNGEILVQWHCYRSDEMLTALKIGEEFGFKVRTFHHAVESYKIGAQLAAAGTCSAMWADWWGFKIEAFDGIRENIPFVHAAGGCAIVHSDSPIGIQRLNQEAAKALAAGRRAGLDISRGEAWRWLSLNPARALGIDATTGSLEPGKAGDVVIWSGDPLSSYSVAERVFIDGAEAYARGAAGPPASDFELGQTVWSAAP